MKHKQTSLTLSATFSECSRGSSLRQDAHLCHVYSSIHNLDHQEKDDLICIHCYSCFAHDKAALCLRWKLLSVKSSCTNNKLFYFVLSDLFGYREKKFILHLYLCHEKILLFFLLQHANQHSFPWAYKILELDFSFLGKFDRYHQANISLVHSFLYIDVCPADGKNALLRHHSLICCSPCTPAEKIFSSFLNTEVECWHLHSLVIP